MRRHPVRALQTLRPPLPSDSFSLVHSYDSDLNPSRPTRSSPLGSSIDTGLPLELLNRLRAFPLFQTAPETFLLSIGKALHPNVYQPAQEIIREGEEAKAMYWLVRGAVRVTSRDGESTYAELKPGAFFGEIGILMDMPRTASIVASMRSLVVRLNKEDLKKSLPSYPDVERAIRDEALERLAILERKKKELNTVVSGRSGNSMRPPSAARKRSRDWVAGDVEMGEAGSFRDGEILSNKKRKSPSPGIAEVAATSVLGSAPLTVRQLLKNLPLFSGMPSDILHFLGINAQPVSHPPFTEIVKQGQSGREVYFILRGEVEVISERPVSRGSTNSHNQTSGTPHVIGGSRLRNASQKVQARLRAGQYFGEVTSLSLAPRRTATVRSVDYVECLLINGDILDELWERCSVDLRQQVESEARRRLRTTRRDDDVVMADAGVGPSANEGDNASTIGNDPRQRRKDSISVVISEPSSPNHSQSSSATTPQMEPIDPDPFFNENLDNMRARSRRSSLAPPVPSSDTQIAGLGHEHQRTPSPPMLRLHPSSPLKPLSSKSPHDPSASASPGSPYRLSPNTTRRPSLDRRASNSGQGRLPDPVMIIVFQHLGLVDMMRARQVSMHWHNVLTTSPKLVQHLDLSIYNRFVTDQVLRDIIVPFVGNRPRKVDLSNCFHVTDDGFKALADACGHMATVWKMKSVWDVTANAILALVERSKGLEEIDLSNCRKVGDNLLARVVGWVVPEPKPGQPVVAAIPHPPLNGRKNHFKRHPNAASGLGLPDDHPPPPPGTIIGAPGLKRITLSYCKHVQDRSMAHIAAHAATRLESLDLTRCTSISDAGFHSWGMHEFHNLRQLVLADCTYLSDQAIIGVVHGCRALEDLDLSFCCALSDTAIEVLSLGLPRLRRLDVAFCGSAVSDNSMRCIALHLLELRHISVRGCVRVTYIGVEAIVDGCRHLMSFDVSQCKNLRPWLESGGVRRVNDPAGGRSIKFLDVADGQWRSGMR